MTFTTIAQTALAKVVASEAGQEIISTMVFHFTEAITQAILDALAAAVRDWWLDSPQAIIVDDMTLQRVDTVDLSSQSGPTSQVVVSSGNAGLDTAEPLPNSAAAVVTERTGFRGRSFRGRYYFPGLSIDSIVGPNVLASSLLTNLATAFGAIGSQIETAVGHGCLHSVASRFHNNIQLNSGFATPILTYAVDSSVDSQRRRLTGRGA
jgi:hypothetical protein